MVAVKKISFKFKNKSFSLLNKKNCKLFLLVSIGIFLGFYVKKEKVEFLKHIKNNCEIVILFALVIHNAQTV
jgi:hypothetical protein